MSWVFVFHGTDSRFANAVFSTRELAEAWIARHALTGLLTGYTMDEPAFDRKLMDGTLPNHVGASVPVGEARFSLSAQTFTDAAVHLHYFYGAGQDSPDYEEMADKWDRDHGTN